MPRSSGPCRDAISMWYYDSSDGMCKQFTYSGCRGNENRFETKESCEMRCNARSQDNTVVGRPAWSGRTAHLRGNSDTPYTSGARIELICDSYGAFPIVWWKNNELLTFSRRIREHDQFKRVTISRAVLADSGEYRCAVGPEGILSNAFYVRVIGDEDGTGDFTKIAENHETDDSQCRGDAGTAKTCSLIVQNGLCAKRRYREFCCMSCRSA
ncbi:hypothetical protein KIN20_007128 [Parelaphostrongylus tenuis]|uniref:Papilin n=1 Tax=Parelaphostrongylus tenuis TaxID=148309 RepID=A0AAD5M2V0_PARTN|nr:hypothetical protein KIN20_007128 [Parelaphostrongylus tenuis]